MKKIISDEVIKSIEDRKSVLQWIPKSFEKYINEETVLVKSNYTTKDGNKNVLSREMEVDVHFIFDLTHKLISKTLRLEHNVYALNASVFRRLYGANYKYIVQFLSDEGFLKKKRNHLVGKYSREYEINWDLFMKPDTKIRFHNTNNTILRKYKQNFYSSQFIDICSEGETESTLSPIKRQLALDLLFVEIDMQASTEYLNSLYESGELSDFAYNRNLMSIEEIAHKQPYFTDDKYGRFHTNFTTLKSHIRSSFLKIDGHPVAEIDIKNCQPRLLIQLLKSDGFDKKHPEEFKKYSDIVTNGLIYEEVMTEASITRKEAKTVMYTVLFGKNMNSCKSTQIFKRLYPNILGWVKAFKGKNHEILAHKLQNMESNLIFNNICTKIKREIPEIRLFTVHDSIYYPEKFKDTVEDIFFREVERLL